MMFKHFWLVLVIFQLTAQQLGKEVVSFKKQENVEGNPQQISFTIYKISPLKSIIEHDSHVNLIINGNGSIQHNNYESSYQKLYLPDLTKHSRIDKFSVVQQGNNYLRFFLNQIHFSDGNPGILIFDKLSNTKYSLSRPKDYDFYSIDGPNVTAECDYVNSFVVGAYSSEPKKIFELLFGFSNNHISRYEFSGIITGISLNNKYAHLKRSDLIACSIKSNDTNKIDILNFYKNKRDEKLERLATITISKKVKKLHGYLV